MFSQIMYRFTLLKHGQFNLRFFNVSNHDLRVKSLVYWARSKLIQCRSVSESSFRRTTYPASTTMTRNLTNVNCHHGNKDADSGRSISPLSTAFKDIRSPFNQISRHGRLWPDGFSLLVTNYQSVRGFASSRGKKTKGKKERRQQDELTDDDESDDDIVPEDERDWDPETDGKMEVEDEEVKDWKDLRQFVPSLRLDAVLGAGLGISRKSVEDAFLSTRLRVNGEKVTKKSKQVKEGDILDLILERSTPSQAGEGDARNEMSVMRIHIKEISADKTGKDRIPVFLRRWKNLLVAKDK
ncbi:uncharacterized protein [Asterias amurensis]|uniref:uncharacterized protein n=1 Tax=Asterias amurensis TaxID=7602 RepID=UPI003AB20AE6